MQGPAAKRVATNIEFIQYTGRMSTMVSRLLMVLTILLCGMLSPNTWRESPPPPDVKLSEITEI